MKASRSAALMGLGGAIIVLALSLTVLIAAGVQAGPVHASIGAPAPDFALHDTDGRAISLQDLRGQTVVLYFAGTHCPVSNAYQKRVIDLAKTYAHRPDVRFLCIETEMAGTRADIEQVRRHIAEIKQPFPTLIDADAAMTSAYEVRVAPTFYLIDPNGVLRYSGAFDDNRDAALVKTRYCAEALKNCLDGVSVVTSSTQAFGCSIERPR